MARADCGRSPPAATIRRARRRPLCRNAPEAIFEDEIEQDNVFTRRFAQPVTRIDPGDDAGVCPVTPLGVQRIGFHLRAPRVGDNIEIDDRLTGGALDCFRLAIAGREAARPRDGVSARSWPSSSAGRPACSAAISVATGASGPEAASGPAARAQTPGFETASAAKSRRRNARRA